MLLHDPSPTSPSRSAMHSCMPLSYLPELLFGWVVNDVGEDLDERVGARLDEHWVVVLVVKELRMP